MPGTKVVFYQDFNGIVPVMDWLLTDVLRKDKKLFAWCFDAIEALEERGYELQRPTAAPLRDGIYELRIKYYRQNYRILYFFHKGSGAMAILAHGIVKGAEVPDKDIDLAIERKTRFESNPEAHTYYEYEED